jgi:uncharacterized lipoprotein YddW (UPF0748 family)
MPLLAARGIDTLFLRWQESSPERFDEAVAAGKKSGVAVHAWVTCWALDALPAAPSDRLMRDAAGNALPWLCPSVPENRARLLDTVRALARRGVAGIHLDYLRYPGETGCYAPATRRAFEAARGEPVAAWPADVLPGGRQAAAFRAFRCETLTACVRDARDAARAVNPSVRLSAAVFPEPADAEATGQAWPVWVREGLLDFVSPMIYTESAARFAVSLDACLAAVPAAKLVPGLGIGADDCQLDAATLTRQLGLCRARGVAGFALFAVDDAWLSR